MNRLESILIKNMKECTGVSIWITSDGELKIFLTVLSKVGKSLKVTRTATFNDISNAIAQIPVSGTLIVSIDGSGIMHKSVNAEDSKDGITKVLPNAKLSDLFIQRIDQGGTEQVIFSVVRKEKINEIISILNGAGLYPFNIILGPFSILHLLPLISADEEITVQEYHFISRERVLISFKRDEQINGPHQVNFGEDEVSSDYLVSLSNCLVFFLSNDLIQNNITILETQRKEFLSKKIIQFAGLVLIILVFLSLLSNVTLHSRYRSENKMLEQTIRTGKKLLFENDSLKKIITDKKTLSEVNSDKASKLFAYYSDRIASIIPSSVTLEGISICPPGKSFKNGNVHIFRKGIISVSGRLNMSGNLDTMIKRITSFAWVKKVQIENYQDQAGDPASFELEIETE